MTERALQALRIDGRPPAGAAPVLPQDPPLLWGQAVGEQPFGRSPSGPEFAADLDATSLISATINGAQLQAQGAGLSLLDWLRERSLTGVKEGCAEGECGSCTVDLDGMAVLSCLVPATRADGATIVTIEGLANNGQPNAGLYRHRSGAVRFLYPGFSDVRIEAACRAPRPDRGTDQVWFIGQPLPLHGLLQDRRCSAGSTAWEQE
ncbi:UNVERIFIED_CONTAM: hypothetical protein GTU68_009940 [Idotea baltica]|nr:hypothetical protein [Idotea baltica]